MYVCKLLFEWMCFRCLSGILYSALRRRNKNLEWALGQSLLCFVWACALIVGRYIYILVKVCKYCYDRNFQREDVLDISVARWRRVWRVMLGIGWLKKRAMVYNVTTLQHVWRYLFTFQVSFTFYYDWFDYLTHTHKKKLRITKLYFRQ